MSKSLKPLDLLLDAVKKAQSQKVPALRLESEPILKGEPFPDLNHAGVDQRRLVVYIYDKKVLATLQTAGILSNRKELKPIEGRDANGTPCTKAYVHGQVYDAYKALHDDTPPVSMQMLGIPVDSSMRLAIADAYPAEEGYEKWLLMKVMGNTADHGTDALIAAGLVNKEDLRSRSKGHPIKIHKESDADACTIALPIPTIVADGILRAQESNRCEDWTTQKAKEDLRIDDVSITELMDVAAAHLNGLVDPSPPRVTSQPAAKAPAAPLAPAIIDTPKTLPPLSFFAEQLKNAGLVKTTQQLMSGAPRTIIGCKDRAALERLSKNNHQHPMTSEPLSLSAIIKVDDIETHPLYYYVIDDVECARLETAMGETLATVSPLPPAVMQSPFKARFSGDMGRKAALSTVVLHREGNEHAMYLVSDSALLLKRIAGDMGFSKEQRTFVTSEDEQPSILKLSITAELFTRLKDEKIGAVRSGRNDKSIALPVQQETSLSGTELEAKLKSTYKVKDKKASPVAPAADTKARKERPSDEEGERLLFEQLKEALTQTPSGKEAKPGSNQQAKKFDMALATVELVDNTSKAKPKEKYTARRLYIRGVKDDLNALGSIIKKQDWLDADQVRHEIGGQDNKMAGLLVITLPDASWEKLKNSSLVPDTLPIPEITPKSRKLSTPKPNIFENAKQAKEGLLGYFDSQQSYGKQIDPNELLFTHLKGKQIRIIDVTKPNPQAIAALDTQIATIKTAMARLQTTIAATQDLHQSSVPTKTGKRGRTTGTLDGVPAILEQSAESARTTLRRHERHVRDLENALRTIQLQNDRVLKNGMYQAIAILDPDKHTDGLLSAAKEVVSGATIKTVGKATYFEPQPGFVKQLADKGIRPPKPKTVEVGHVDDEVRKARSNWLREQTRLEDQKAGQGDTPHQPAIHKPRIKRPPKSARRLCEDVHPLLCYETILLPNGKPSGETQPVLILPLENAKMATAASRLCTVLETTGWLEPPTFYVLSHAPEGHASAMKTPAITVRPENTFDADVLSQLSGIIGELKFHINQSSDFSRQATVGFLADLHNFVRNGIAHEGEKAEQPSLAQRRTMREIVNVFTESGMEKLVHTITQTDHLNPQATQNLKTAINTFEGKIKALSDTRSSADEIAEHRLPMERQKGKPFPYTLPASAATDDGIYPEILRRHQAQLATIQGDARPVPAVKLYISKEAAESFQAHGNQSGVDITHADKSISPHAMETFVYHALTQREQARGNQTVTGRG